MTQYRQRDGCQEKKAAAVSICDTHRTGANLDSFFDPAQVRSEQAAYRQKGLVNLAWRFALASLIIPIAGIIPGLLAVLIAQEARSMLNLVGGTAADDRRVRNSFLVGIIMACVWLVVIIALICIVTVKTSR